MRLKPKSRSKEFYFITVPNSEMIASLNVWSGSQSGAHFTLIPGRRQVFIVDWVDSDATSVTWVVTSLTSWLKQKIYPRKRRFIG